MEPTRGQRNLKAVGGRISGGRKNQTRPGELRGKSKQQMMWAPEEKRTVGKIL
jgi:hypothetical protein